MQRLMTGRIALATAVLLSCGGGLGNAGKRGAQVTMPFDAKKAAALLGHPGETFEQVSPYQLPEIYWLRIGSGANVFGGPFIVRNGELVVTKGYPTASAWLRRVVMPMRTAPEAAYVAQVLGQYDALPLGWGPPSAEVDDPATGERGHLRLQPFELELVWREHIHTMSRLLKAPMSGPPGPPNPPGGPSGPGGGYAPPQACRAILKEVDGKLTWIVEQHHDDGSWTLLLKEPIE
jgi:hypothetical protein